MESPPSYYSVITATYFTPVQRDRDNVVARKASAALVSGSACLASIILISLALSLLSVSVAVRTTSLDIPDADFVDRIKTTVESMVRFACVFVALVTCAGVSGIYHHAQKLQLGAACSSPSVCTLTDCEAANVTTCTNVDCSARKATSAAVPLDQADEEDSEEDSDGELPSSKESTTETQVSGVAGPTNDSMVISLLASTSDKSAGSAAGRRSNVSRLPLFDIIFAWDMRHRWLKLILAWYVFLTIYHTYIFCCFSQSTNSGDASAVIQQIQQQQQGSHAAGAYADMEDSSTSEKLKREGIISCISIGLFLYASIQIAGLRKSL